MQGSANSMTGKTCLVTGATAGIGARRLHLPHNIEANLVSMKTLQQPVFDGRSWAGVARAFGTRFVVELFESRRSPGCYHYAAHCTSDGFANESEKPVSVSPLAPTGEPAILVILRMFISRLHGLTMNDFCWSETTGDELPMSAERFKAGA
jgi:hypothetical protein